MKTGLTKKQKVTELYFNENDALTEVYTHNTELKKRLLAPTRPNIRNCASRPMTTTRVDSGLRLPKKESVFV